MFAIALSYVVAPVPVSVAVDGRTMDLETNGGAVRDVLVAHDIEVRPNDLVVPAPDSRVGPGDRISIQSARPVLVRVDGQTIAVRSHAETPLALLHEAGVELGPRDAIAVDGRRWPADERLPIRDGERTVEVLRATALRVVENGIPVEIGTAGRTIGEALEVAGVELHDEDVVRPDRDATLNRAPGIVIERAVPFTLDADGTSRDVRAAADTVRDALAVLDLKVNEHDYTIPEIGSALVPGLRVQVVRVKEDILVQEVAIAYATDLQPNPGMALDTRGVVRPGQQGLKTQTIRITYEDGEEIDRQVVDETVLTPPVSEIVDYGTNIVWQTVDTPAGPLRYWRKLHMYATSYSASRAGTPRSAPWYGMTRLGWQVVRGVVATDPRIVPLRTHLYVPGYGPAVAADTGGGVRNYMIDLGFEDDEYESWHEWLDVYLVEPLPDEDDIRWVMP